MRAESPNLRILRSSARQGQRTHKATMYKYEKQLDRCTRRVRELLGDSIRTVVELGARDCHESVAFATLLPQAVIYAFECNPDTLPLCRLNSKGVSNVHLIELAIADRCGTISFFKTDPSRTITSHENGNPGASSLFVASGKYPVETYGQTEIRVAATTLQAFMLNQGLATIDLLWMDLQGAELMALMGLGHNIHNVKVIHTEVEFFEIYSGQPLYRDVRNFLKQHGFRLLTFTNFGRYAGDCMFVNTSLVGNGRMPDWTIYQWHKWKWIVLAVLKQTPSSN